MRASFNGMYTEDRIHTRLLINNCLVMTDAAFEHQTNFEVVSQATGDVLIAGLGIGMILTRILDRKEVSSVTVVEKSLDVIRLVGPHFSSPKLTIVEGDIYRWIPKDGVRFDTIYFDIWPDICTDSLDDVTKLHRRFRKYLRTGGWMGSWCRDYLRDMKRRGR